MSSAQSNSNSSNSSAVLIGASAAIGSALLVLGAGYFASRSSSNGPARSPRDRSVDEFCEVLKSLPEEDWSLLKPQLDRFLHGTAPVEAQAAQVKAGVERTVPVQPESSGSLNVEKPKDQQKIEPVEVVQSSSHVDMTRGEASFKVVEQKEGGKAESIAEIPSGNHADLTRKAAKDVDAKATTESKASEETPALKSAPGASEEKKGVQLTTPTSNDPPELRKFRTMLKVGIHPDAVRAKMVLEGVDPSLMFKEECPKEEDKSGAPEPTKVAQDDPALAKYRTMLKVGIHPDAVKSKMRVEGLDPALLFPSAAPATKTPLTKSKKTPVTCPLGELQPVELVSEKSLWRKNAPSQAIIDFEAVGKLFRQTKKKVVKDSKVNANSEDDRENHRPNESQNDRMRGDRKSVAGKSLFAFLQPRRAQNLQIGLAKFKVDPDTMCLAVSTMDAELLGKKGDEDALHLLQNLLPTEEEMTAALKFNRNEASLSDVERLVRLFAMRVPDVHARVEAMIFVARFPNQVKDLREEMALVSRVIYLANTDDSIPWLLLQALNLAVSVFQIQGGEDMAALSMHGLGDRLRKVKSGDGRLSAADILAGITKTANQQLPLLEPSFSSLRAISAIEADIRELTKGIDKKERLELTQQDGEFSTTARKEISALTESLEGIKRDYEWLLEYYGQPKDTPLSVFFQDLCSLVGAVHSCAVAGKFERVMMSAISAEETTHAS